MQFDPFGDRLSRDIRNDLSATMATMLDQLDLAPAQEVAERYLEMNLESSYKEYISERLSRYQSALKVIQNGPTDVFWRALVLWDRKLFFEMHEILEHAWYRAKGDEKKILQAMIRAAGVYIKLEYGYIAAARKMAKRALPALLEQNNFLARYFDPARLITALLNLDPDPPRLLS